MEGVFTGSKREIVTTMGPAWFIVQSLLFSRGGEHNEHCNGSTNLFISPKWLSQPFGMTVSGFWISAGIPFVPISLALPADKREYGDANLYLVFTGYNGIIPQSPIANRSNLVTGQIFHQ